MTHTIGDIVTMTRDALDNYGDKWRDVELEITHKATAYMPAAEFYTQGKPEGYHPGFDGDADNPLYDLRVVESGEPLSFSLYEWEVRAAHGESGSELRRSWTAKVIADQKRVDETCAGCVECEG